MPSMVMCAGGEGGSKAGPSGPNMGPGGSDGLDGHQRVTPVSSRLSVDDCFTASLCLMSACF